MSLYETLIGCRLGDERFDPLDREDQLELAEQRQDAETILRDQYTGEDFLAFKSTLESNDWEDSDVGRPELVRVAWNQFVRSRNRLALSGVRLCVQYVSDTPTDRIPDRALLSECLQTTLRAAEKFDPDRGLKFSTFQTFYLKKARHRIRKIYHTVTTLPSHVLKNKNRVESTRNNPERPDDPESEKTAAQLTDAEYRQQSRVPEKDPITTAPSADRSTVWEGHLAGRSADCDKPLEELAWEECKHLLDRFRDRYLDDREDHIFEAVILGNQTAADLADQYGVTSQAINQSKQYIFDRFEQSPHYRLIEQRFDVAQHPEQSEVIQYG